MDKKSNKAPSNFFNTKIVLSFDFAKLDKGTLFLFGQFCTYVLTTKKRIELYSLYAFGVPGGTRTHIGGLGGSCVIPLRYGNILIEFFNSIPVFILILKISSKIGHFC